MSQHLAAEAFLIQPLLLSDSTLSRLLDDPSFASSRFCVDEKIWAGWKRIKGSGQLQTSGDQLISERQSWRLAMAAARDYPLATCPIIDNAASKEALEHDLISIHQKFDVLKPHFAVDAAASNCSLFVDEFGLFFLVYNIQIVSTSEGEPENSSHARCGYAELVVCLRKLVELRRPACWHHSVEIQASREINELLGRIGREAGTTGHSIRVEPNTGHMLTFFYQNFSGEPGDVHAAEETREQYQNYPTFVNAYREATGHFGFSNTTLSNIPRTRAIACLPFCCYLQSSWYLIGFFRRYMMNLMSSLYETGTERPLSELTREIDQIVLAYEKF